MPYFRILRRKHHYGPVVATHRLGSENASQCVPIASMMPSEDGHPYLSPCGDFLVTDTYPDKMGLKDIIVKSSSALKVMLMGF